MVKRSVQAEAGKAERQGGGMKKIFAGLAVALMVASACGGSNGDTTTSAALEDVAVSECVQAPVAVGGFTILGSHRIEGISDLKVCVDANARAGVVPQVINQPDCGSPCFTIEVRNLDIAADEKVEITMKRDGVPAQPITFDPEPLNPSAGNETGRICVIGHGGPPDPCAERVTSPKNLTAAPARTKMTLNWSPSKDTGDGDLQGYELWRSTTGEEGSFVYVSTLADTTALDSGLTRKQQYWYYVVAFDGDGHRTASDIATATTK